ncbi:MAPEG family protein [Erythrobacter sp. SCSIO 43205]|uniref:MAPEG family protein n=1 Tax=Erythrobacter sp. SCSIO 43205 TaxID=2779361 RepID=UPI001CA9510C|nr:MAPEG family protein [Erythrobacter sp. SCSIO 43205]UAB78811.1 MAPEG family protein [Erythrobacter sp. SCSIO 43205]
MSIEMWSIAVLSFILLAITMVQGGLVPATQGLRWGLGSRDEPLEKSVMQGRFARTVQNHAEAMLIYVPLMGLVIALDKTNSFTQIAAWLMIAGRLVFTLFYLTGTFGLRSAGYAMGLAAIFITAWHLVT